MKVDLYLWKKKMNSMTFVSLIHRKCLHDDSQVIVVRIVKSTGTNASRTTRRAMEEAAAMTVMADSRY